MNEQENITGRLWSYIDGQCTPEEGTVIEELLRTNAAWKKMYGELLEVNELLHQAPLEAPSMRFTKNVMEEITKMHIAPATRSYINKKIIWGLGIFFVTMVVGFLVYGFGQMDWTATGDSTISQNMRKLDFSKFFSNTWVNVFMMVNVVLGLVLLDHYLAVKRKAFRKEA